MSHAPRELLSLEAPQLCSACAVPSRKKLFYCSSMLSESVLDIHVVFMNGSGGKEEYEGMFLHEERVSLFRSELRKNSGLNIFMNSM